MTEIDVEHAQSPDIFIFSNRTLRIGLWSYINTFLIYYFIIYRPYYIMCISLKDYLLFRECDKTVFLLCCDCTLTLTYSPNSTVTMCLFQGF